MSLGELLNKNFTRREVVAYGVVGMRSLVAAPIPVGIERETLSPLPHLATGVNMFNGLYTPGVERELDEVAAMGGSTIRVMVAHRDHSVADSASRLGMFLDIAAKRNLKVIPSLVDFYGDKGFHPPGMDREYRQRWRNIPILDDSFFTKDVDPSFMELLATTIAENRGHPAVYAWEPGNELKASQNPYALVKFMRTTTDIISNLDPATPISSGIISSESIGLSPAEFYGRLPHVDIVTGHAYNLTELESAKRDFEWALRNNKTPIVEELGFKGTNRTDLYRKAFSRLGAAGVGKVLLHGFIAKHSPDNRNGDREFGMDAIWNTDYDELRELVKTVSAKKAPVPGSTQIFPEI